MDEAENKVSSITDNPHVMRQYEERKKEIAKLQEQLDGADEEKDIKKKQLEVKLTTWEASLINIVDSVSQKFSAYMKEVGCAGEVRLFKANRDARGGDDEEENLVYNFKVRLCLYVLVYCIYVPLHLTNTQQHHLSCQNPRIGVLRFLSSSEKLLVFKFYRLRHIPEENDLSVQSCTSWDFRISCQVHSDALMRSIKVLTSVMKDWYSSVLL